MNILVFPCGSEIGLEIHNSLKNIKDITLYGGTSTDDHGRMVYRHYINNIPNIREEKFINELNKVVDEYDIDLIIPAHDSVVLKLAQESNHIDAHVLTSDIYTCEVCRSKKNTYELFKEYDMVPRVYSNKEAVKEYPIFMKPDVGQGSQGIALALNYEDINYNLAKDSSLIMVEYLPGKEYTIDCFTDKNGKLRFIGTRDRKRTKSGISVNSCTLETTEEISNIAHQINDKLDFRGMWFFQLKEDCKGKLKLLEIAPRIAGTMSLYRNKGINFTLLAIYDRLGYEIDIIDNKIKLEVDRALTNRFILDYEYNTVFIDFDDTITKNKRVNPYIIMYLYQCVEKNKDIYLITKHSNNIENTLYDLKIEKRLFKDIIHIKYEEKKAEYLRELNSNCKSIFIDDSFIERKSILEELEIPVFDVDAIEALIDWRC